VAHTYDPGYLGGRDQEDRVSKPVSDKWFAARPYLEKKNHHQKALVELLQGIGPEFKTQYQNQKSLDKYSYINNNSDKRFWKYFNC
jgi:hypothetical protein